MWQAERRAKRARQKGGEGLRAALGTSAPPRPASSSEKQSLGLAGRLGRDCSGWEAWPGALLRGGVTWAGLPACVQLQVEIKVR